MGSDIGHAFLAHRAAQDSPSVVGHQPARCPANGPSEPLWRTLDARRLIHAMLLSHLGAVAKSPVDQRRPSSRFMPTGQVGGLWCRLLFRTGRSYMLDRSRPGYLTFAIAPAFSPSG